MSDTFENGTIGDSVHEQPLDNALGGSASATWLDPLGIATYQVDGASQVMSVARPAGGWSKFKTLCSYPTDPNKSYVLEFRQKRPTGVLDGDNWTAHGGATVLSTDNIEMDGGMGGSGIILRLQSAAVPGANDPDWYSVFANRGGNMFSHHMMSGPITAEDVAGDGYIPVRILFSGAGTAESPATFKLYLNGNEKGSFTVDNLANPGNLVGVINQTSTLPDYDPGMVDDFKLAEITGVDPTVTIAQKDRYPVYLPTDTVLVSGSGVKDGFVPMTSGLTWSTESGPAEAIFADPNAATTEVTFPQPGTYVLKLTLDTGSATATDTITFVVRAGILTATPILSDDFEGADDGDPLNGRVLNNALGGAETATWSDDLGLAWLADSSGDVICKLGPNAGWPNTKITCDYEIDPTRSYRLEALLKLPTGIDGTAPAWNRPAGPGLLSEADQGIDHCGVIFRFTSDSPNEGLPNTVNVIDVNGRLTGGWSWNSLRVGGWGQIDPATDLDANGWLPVCIEFTGDGTPANPLRGRILLNGNYRGEFTTSDLGAHGYRISFSTTQFSQDDPLQIAQFVLSELEWEVPAELSEFMVE
ncbi:MAG TPA: hypothetical protein PLS90_12980 [Candidatus Sumerlaeota bacterium]|nr:hypothetical protein [Candidatus Sumerlaeota bacterium]HPK03359.1 hypothetical protein [Candidatus Sumerlaeota bacterium]